MGRTRRKRKFGTTEKRMLTGCFMLVVSALLTVLSGQSLRMAEWYSTHIYSVIVSAVGRFSGLFSCSLAELCLYVLVLLTVGSLIHAVVEAARRGSGGAVMLRWASGLFLTFSILMVLYVVNCGINYRRVSFSEKSGIETTAYTVEDLKQACLWLTEEVNTRAGQVKRDENGVMMLECAEEKDAVNAMQALGRQYPALEGYYPRPKGFLVSEILSYQGLTGVYVPFTVEANYNKDMTAYNIPFTACHELSHLRGFMQEEEANFIAFLACKDAERGDFQYSGYLMGWIYSMNALRRADAEAWQEVRAALDERVEADLQANSRFWAKYDGAVAEVSNKVNDTYLKANGQEDGVESYDRMVDLIVGYWMK